MKLILEDVLSKILKSLERGYLSATVEYHFVNTDTELQDAVNSNNDYAVFFGRKALITREDRFKSMLKEMLKGINFELDYCDVSYDNRGNIVNVLLSVSLEGERNGL